MDKENKASVDIRVSESSKKICDDKSSKKEEKTQSNAEENEVKTGQILSKKFRCFVFVMATITSVTLNMDHGSIPAITSELRTDLSIGDTELGLFGSLVYLGNFIGAVALMKLINIINRKYLLIINLLLNGLFMYFFTITKKVGFLYFVRISIGIFQAYISIYFPVWVDQFGPRNSKTIMMAFIQVASPLGIVLGYALTTGIVMGMGGHNWKLSFIIQAIMLGLLAVAFFFIDNSYFSSTLFLVAKNLKVEKFEEKALEVKKNALQIENLEEDKVEVNKMKEIVEDEIKIELHDQKMKENVDYTNVYKSEKQPVLPVIDPKKAIMDATVMQEVGLSQKVDEENTAEDASFFQDFSNDPAKTNRDFWQDSKSLLTDKLYILSTLSVTTLLFISTAIVYWTSDYLEKVLVVSKERVLIIFIITCITAPSLGIVIGGCIVQKIGGYESKHSIMVCFVYALIAWILAIPIYWLDFTGFAFCLWLILFFGGSIIPNLMGIMISCLDKDLRATGNSLSNIFMNLLGFLPAPFVYGIINDSTKGTSPKIAFTVVLNYAFVGCVLILIASIMRYNNFKEKNEETQTKDIGLQQVPADSKIDNSQQVVKNQINDLNLKEDYSSQNQIEKKNSKKELSDIDEFKKEMMKFNSMKGKENYMNLDTIGVKEKSIQEASGFVMSEIHDDDVREKREVETKAKTMKPMKPAGFDLKKFHSDGGGKNIKRSEKNI